LCGKIFGKTNINLFEILSAIGTVGMSTGITRQLTGVSRFIIVVLMYCGRIGSLAVPMAVAESKSSVIARNPLEKIIIG